MSLPVEFASLIVILIRVFGSRARAAVVEGCRSRETVPPALQGWQLDDLPAGQLVLRMWRRSRRLLRRRSPVITRPRALRAVHGFLRTRNCTTRCESQTTVRVVDGCSSLVVRRLDKEKCMYQ